MLKIVLLLLFCFANVCNASIFETPHEAGIADGQEVWVVVGGIVEVLLDDNVAAVRGYWMGTGAAGYAQTAATAPDPTAPDPPTHFQEIGHCIRSVDADGPGTHALAKIVMHFN